MFFCVITKNLNLEILTKNLVTFKRWDMVKDEKFNMGVHWKIRFLGGLQKINILEGIAKKRGAWEVCRFKRGLFKKEGGAWYPNVHYDRILKN